MILRCVLVQVNADNVVGFEFIRDRAITLAGNHGCQRFCLLHEIFVADRVEETLTDCNIAEIDAAAWRRGSHVCF